MEKVYPLESSKDLDPLLERIGKAQVVLLGEASHGTHEYYTWRNAISRRLITEKGFRFIAVEGDWPDCYKLNRYIKGYEQQDVDVREVLTTFNRWPSWMWANWETAAMLSWIKAVNKGHSADKRIGFYGLDVYSLWESLEALVKYLRTVDLEAAVAAEEALRCFTIYGRNERFLSSHVVPASCRQRVIDLLTQVNAKAPTYNHDPEASLNAVQNANITMEAERYYRSVVMFNDDSWNIRDRHMMETLKRIIEFHGPGTKAIVWAHNTHIGDARYTDMKQAGLLNLGELAREHYGRKHTVLVGFGSYSGKVLAGRTWSAPVEEMDVPEAEDGSAEDILHQVSEEDRLLIFDQQDKSGVFSSVLPHRAIGVVYNPQRESANYVPTLMQERYDAFIYIDRTTALHELHVRPDKRQVPEAFPFEF